MLLWCSFTTPLKLDNPDLQEIHDACADLGRGEEEEEDDDEKDSHEDDSEDEEAAERLALGKKAGLTGTDPEPSRCGRNDNWTLKRENKIHKAKQERQSLLDQSFSGMDGGERKQAGEKEFKGKTLIDFGEISPSLPTAAVQINSIPPNPLPSISAADLLCFKIKSCGLRLTPAKELRDATDTARLLSTLAQSSSLRLNGAQERAAREGLVVVAQTGRPLAWWKQKFGLS